MSITSLEVFPDELICNIANQATDYAEIVGLLRTNLKINAITRECVTQILTGNVKIQVPWILQFPDLTTVRPDIFIEDEDDLSDLATHPRLSQFRLYLYYWIVEVYGDPEDPEEKRVFYTKLINFIDDYCQGTIQRTLDDKLIEFYIIDTDDTITINGSKISFTERVTDDELPLLEAINSNLTTGIREIAAPYYNLSEEELDRINKFANLSTMTYLIDPKFNPLNITFFLSDYTIIRVPRILAQLTELNPEVVRKLARNINQNRPEQLPYVREFGFPLYIRSVKNYLRRLPQVEVVHILYDTETPEQLHNLLIMFPNLKFVIWKLEGGPIPENDRLSIKYDLS